MPSFAKSVNFGKTKGGLDTVGYRLIDMTGAEVSARSINTREALAGIGIYTADVFFPDDFRGTILWDTGGDDPVYATEDYDYTSTSTSIVEQVNATTSTVISQVDAMMEQIVFIRGLTAGRWTLNKKDATMEFYDESGQNLLITYQLRDENKNPSIESVFDRTIVESKSPAMLTMSSLPLTTVMSLFGHDLPDTTDNNE